MAAAMTAEALQAQLAEKCKQYESKIAALGAINSALQKENDKLRREAAREPMTDAEEELEDLRDEFQERLGAADRTIASLQEEKQRLSAALAAANAGGNASESRLAELQSTVDTLKSEGDALSRKAGDLEATCRKLRSANKELETERERAQSRIKALEGQVLEMQEAAEAAAHASAQQVDELERELSEVRLDAKKQVAEARRAAQDAQLRAEAEAARGGAELVAAARDRETAMAAQVVELREALLAASTEAANKEDSHRRQVHLLEESIRALETQRDDMASSAGDVTRPLLKQIESMAGAAAAAAEAARSAEQHLSRRLQEAEEAASLAAAGERAATGRATAAEAGLAAAREAATAAGAAAAELRARLESVERAGKTIEAEKEAVEERLAAVAEREERYRTEAEHQRRELAEQLLGAEQRIRTLELERDELLQRVEAWAANGTPHPPSSDQHTATTHTNTNVTNATNATPSKRVSLSGTARRQSSSSGATQVGPEAVSGRFPEVGTRDMDGQDAPKGLSESDASELDVLLQGFTDAAVLVAEEQRIKRQQQRGGGGGLFDGLLRPQPASKVDAGALVRTVELLQQRLQAAERARDLASEQLFTAFRSADASSKEVQEAQDLRRALNESRRRCDMALELLGERNERIEQLEEDIHDMKSIFRTQIEDCVAQLQKAQSDLARLQGKEKEQEKGVQKEAKAEEDGLARGHSSMPGSVNMTPESKKVFSPGTKRRD